jgi:L-asparaginase
MRPSTALGADGPLNLSTAVAVAADPDARGRGVLLVINDDVHGARGVTKSNTTDVQTFRSPERGLIGTTLFGSNRFYRKPDKRHTADSEFTIAEVDALPRVEIVYAHAGMNGDLIDAAVASGAKGIVVAGTGNGNMGKPALDALARAAEKGVVCVRSTRVGSGVVDRNIEVDDDGLGLVASLELNPAKARVLLKLALLKTTDPAEIQGFFRKY